MKNTDEMREGHDAVTGPPNPDWMGKTIPESGRRRVFDEFLSWASSIKNVNLVAKAMTLWNYLHDKQVPGTDKAIIIAALLYCIVPLDLVPDCVPVAGVLDDLAVVVSVLTYVDVKTAENRGAATHVESCPDVGDGIGDGCATGKKHDETAL